MILYKAKCDIYFIIYLLCYPWSDLSKHISSISDFESFEKLRNLKYFGTVWNFQKYYDYFKHLRKFWKFWKIQKISYFWNIPKIWKIWFLFRQIWNFFVKCRKFWKILKCIENFKKFKKFWRKKLLEDNITSGFSQFPLHEPWDSPLQKWYYMAAWMIFTSCAVWLIFVDHMTEFDQ